MFVENRSDIQPRLVCGKSFLRSYAKLRASIQRKADDFFEKFYENSKSVAINLEKFVPTASEYYRSVRIDKAYRAIVAQPENDKNFYLLWVDAHMTPTSGQEHTSGMRIQKHIQCRFTGPWIYQIQSNIPSI